MEVKVEAEQVAKIHNLRNLQNFIGCENSQPYKISAVVHFSLV